MTATTTAPATTEPTRYRFAGPDGRLWLGLGPLPIATLGCSLVLAVLLLYLGAPLPLTLLLTATGVTAGVVPVAGRPLISWALPVTRHAAADANGSTSWTRAVLHPQPRRTRARQLPPEFGRCQILDDTAGVLAAMVDGNGTATVVLTVAGSDRFALLDPAEQARHVAGWGTALSTLATDPDVLRMQWTHRVSPETAEPASWLRDRHRGSDKPAVDDYVQMTDQLRHRAVRHETWLAVRLAYRAQRDGVDALVERTRSIAGVLLGSDLLARPLNGHELGWLVRRFADHRALAHAQTVTTVATCSRRTGWSQLQTDDSLHRSFAVVGWPRLPVLPGWLEPLLHAPAADAARTVSVHLQPVAAALAARQARADRTRARLDAADRARLGFADSTATAWAEADAAGTEEELLAGYRLHRVAGVVLCSAGTPALLDEACRAMAGAAATARVDVRPLHGQHDIGFVAATPLCRPAGGSR